MIAVDSNLLVYAHREDSSFHAAAATRLTELAEGRASWGIPWPCIHEFFAVATNPRAFARPSSQQEAIEAIEHWLRSPTLRLLHETDEHWRWLRDLILRGKTRGPAVHDARIAAICLQHGVREFWTADRDFSRFPALTARNPLLG